MKKQLYNKKNGLKYTLQGDYYFPELTINEEKATYGKYGMMRKKYLEENQFLLYERMAMNGTLFPEMRKVDEAADQIKKQMLPKLAQEAGATDELKRTDQFEWVRRMEACNHQVEEVILAELVYS